MEKQARKTHMMNVTVRMPQHEILALDNLSTSMGTTRTRLIRQAVSKLLKQGD